MTVAVPCPTLAAKDAAVVLGVKENTLAIWRCSKRYVIPYIRVGRNIRYRISDLEKFLADHTVCADSAN